MVHRHAFLLVVGIVIAMPNLASAGMIAQTVLVPNDFPAPANSRDLDARVGTAIRAPSILIGEKGDEIITREGPHSLNGYLKNVRVYARDDGGLEIRFNITPDPGDTFTWPPQIPTRLLVRLFDENGQYLTHFLTYESFAPTETVAHYLTSGAIGMLNPSPVLLMDSDGKTNVVVYTVNKRDLDYARIAEVGFFLRPVQASDMQPVPENQQWLPPGESRPSAPARHSCRDYMKCLAPKGGLRAKPTTSTAPTPPKVTQEICTVGAKGVALRSATDFKEILLGGADRIDDPDRLARFEAVTPVCTLPPGENVALHEIILGKAFYVGRLREPMCAGITLTRGGFRCR